MPGRRDGRRASRRADVDDIVAKNLQAKGGADKLQAVQSMKQTAHVTFQGMTGTITVYGKRPNMVRQEIAVAGQTVVNAFDGTTAWSINPLNGSSDPIGGDRPAGRGHQDAVGFRQPARELQGEGLRARVRRHETIGGRKAYHLKLTSKDHRVQHLYIDAETSLEMKIVGDCSLGSRRKRALRLSRRARPQDAVPDADALGRHA